MIRDVLASLAVAATFAALITGGALMAAGIDNPNPPELEDPTSTTATTKPELDPPPLAPGFENYKPGDELPTPPTTTRALAPGETVPTVAGPHGPIFPDGYRAPDVETPEGFTPGAPPPLRAPEPIPPESED